PVADLIPQGVRDALAVPPDRRTPGQSAAIFSYWRTTLPEWKDANSEIEKLWREHPMPATQLVYAERDKPRHTSLLTRGDFLKPVREVKPGVQEFIHSQSTGAKTARLTFARCHED